AGRERGRLPQRRRVRGTARPGLGTALVARRGQRIRDPGDDPQRPPHRAAHPDRAGRRRGWLAGDVRHNGFAPTIVDGRDPAAVACAIVEAEDALRAFAADPQRRYPARLPYVIAETEKGFGFPGAGT